MIRIGFDSHKGPNFMTPRSFRSCLVLLVGAFAALATLSAPAAAQSAVNGETLFRQRCQTCHSVAPDKTTPLGPNLRGVFGRKAGATAFRYSDALKKSGVVWSQATLDRYLAAPLRLVPGTRMTVALPNAAQRAAILDYLARQK
jgi:cytochrome c